MSSVESIKGDLEKNKLDIQREQTKVDEFGRKEKELSDKIIELRRDLTAVELKRTQTEKEIRTFEDSKHNLEANLRREEQRAA